MPRGDQGASRQTRSARYRCGNHLIFVGEVRSIRRTERRPLVFGSGQYLVADAHDLGKPPPGLASTDERLLARPLPPLRKAEVEATVYDGGRGTLDYRSQDRAAIADRLLAASVAP